MIFLGTYYQKFLEFFYYVISKILAKTSSILYHRTYFVGRFREIYAEYETTLIFGPKKIYRVTPLNLICLVMSLLHKLVFPAISRDRNRVIYDVRSHFNVNFSYSYAKFINPDAAP